MRGARTWNHGPRGVAVDAILLEPVAITRENLSLVIDAGWAPRTRVRLGAVDPPPPACAGG